MAFAIAIVYFLHVCMFSNLSPPLPLLQNNSEVVDNKEGNNKEGNNKEGKDNNGNDIRNSTN